MATGLLIVLVGKATKASDQLMAQDKEYLGEATLGVVTEAFAIAERLFDLPALWAGGAPCVRALSKHRG